MWIQEEQRLFLPFGSMNTWVSGDWKWKKTSWVTSDSLSRDVFFEGENLSFYVVKRTVSEDDKPFRSRVESTVSELADSTTQLHTMMCDSCHDNSISLSVAIFGLASPSVHRLTYPRQYPFPSASCSSPTWTQSSCLSRVLQDFEV